MSISSNIIFEHYQKTKAKKYDDIEFLYIGGKDRYSFWNDFLNKFKIKTYFIGDLDNIFKSSFNIISDSDLESLKNDFDREATTITLMQSDPKYGRDSAKYLKDLLCFIKSNKPTKWSEIKTNIESKYSEKIFFLQNGELENYTNSNKKLEGVISFCKK